MPVALFVLSAAALVGLWWLTPDLQLLASDTDKTRFRRFWAAVWLVALSVLASIIAGVFMALSSTE